MRDEEGILFMPQTALLRSEADRGFEPHLARPDTEVQFTFRRSSIAARADRTRTIRACRRGSTKGTRPLLEKDNLRFLSRVSLCCGSVQT
jgi:hypothetical protein